MIFIVVTRAIILILRPNSGKHVSKLFQAVIYFSHVHSFNGRQLLPSHACVKIE